MALDLEKAKATVAGMMADLERLSKIVTAHSKGARVSAADDAWAGGVVVAGAVPDAIASTPVGAKAVQEILGVGLKRWERLVADGLPSEGPDQFLLARVVQWRVARLEEEAKRAGKEAFPLPAPRAIDAMACLRQPAAAWLAGISSRALRDDTKIGRNPDLTYNARRIVEWAAARSVEPRDDDPLLSGTSSPNLEAYRAEKAREARRRNDEAEGMLMQAAEIGNALSGIARVFRETASAIERIHGPEVGKVVRDMIDQAEREWTKAVPVEKSQEAPCDGEAPRRVSRADGSTTPTSTTPS